MNIGKIKKFLLQTAIVVPIGIVVIGSIVYYETKNSEEYYFASNYIREDQTLEKEIGKISDISLSLRGGIKTQHRGNAGSAKLSLKAQGERGNATIQFEMKKSNGVWSIEKVTVLNKEAV